MTTDWPQICVMQVCCGWVIYETLSRSAVLGCSLYRFHHHHRHNLSKKIIKINKNKHPVRCHCCTYIFILNTCGVDKNNKSQPWHSTGNAGFRLHFPAHFELVGDQEARHQESEGEQNRMEQLPRQQPVARSVEACIGQKLQLIGDQFHREHLQLVRSNYASCWLYKLFAL